MSYTDRESGAFGGTRILYLCNLGGVRMSAAEDTTKFGQRELRIFRLLIQQA
jgi:hypothetical protein